MQKRVLGKTGLEVSVIGFGGIPLQRVNKEQAVELMEKALEQGINFIDTARGYTISEELIGHHMVSNRNKWIVATKSMSRSYEEMKKDIQISLNNLQTDHIDLYQCHLVRTEEQLEEIMGGNGAYKALLEAKAEGKIGHIGFTSHDVAMLEKAIDSGYFETVQFPYNIVEHQAEEQFKRAKEKNIGIIVMKPLAGGAIDDGSLALRHIVENEDITTVIPGMDKVEQIIENAGIGQNIRAITAEEREKIQKIAEDLGETFCRRCGYCAPCPQGIDIPLQFLLQGYYLRYELEDWSKERYDSLEKKAEDCKKCGLCEPKCPYNLPIRDMLEKVSKDLSGAKGN